MSDASARGLVGDDDDNATAAPSPPGPVASAYAGVAGPLGEFARTIDLGSEVLPGAALTDPEWLAERVADTGRRWDHDDPRVNGTLWWYSASSSLVVAPLTMLLTADVAPDPRPDRLTISLQPNGYLRAARSDRLLGPGGSAGAGTAGVGSAGVGSAGAGRAGAVAAFAEALAEAHAAVIAALAVVSGAAPRALWAIASDSIGNRALEAGRAVGDPDRGVELARAVCAAPLLPPRYIDVAGPVRSRTFVRRSSCCLIYAATDGDKCVSCPRRTPADRHAQLLLRT